MPDTLYFAYDASLDPDRMTVASPGARFVFTAHYPETRLAFVPGKGNDEAVATLVADTSHTVWGGVFEIPDDEVDTLVGSLGEGRSMDFDSKAVDREGNKHDCLTFVASTVPDDDSTRPTREYVDAMVRGARHWNLPAGWVMGLEDFAEDPLFS